MSVEEKVMPPSVEVRSRPVVANEESLTIPMAMEMPTPTLVPVVSPSALVPTAFRIEDVAEISPLTVKAVPLPNVA